MNLETAITIWSIILGGSCFFLGWQWCNDKHEKRKNFNQGVKNEKETINRSNFSDDDNHGDC